VKTLFKFFVVGVCVMLALLVPEMFGLQVIRAWGPWWLLTICFGVGMFAAASCLKDEEDARKKEELRKQRNMTL